MASHSRVWPHRHPLTPNGPPGGAQNPRPGHCNLINASRGASSAPLSMLTGSIFIVNWTRCPLLTAVPLQRRGSSSIRRHLSICLNQHEPTSRTAVQLLNPCTVNAHIMMAQRLMRPQAAHHDQLSTAVHQITTPRPMHDQPAHHTQRCASLPLFTAKPGHIANRKWPLNYHRVGHKLSNPVQPS